MSALVEEKTTEVVCGFPLLSTVVNTETTGTRVNAVVWGTVEDSFPGVPFIFRLDKLILIVHSEHKRSYVYLEVVTVSVLTALGEAAGAVLGPGEEAIVIVFPLPCWAAAFVSCADKFEAAGACNWTSCDGAFGEFWITLLVGEGRFVATPLDSLRTRPSSKVVIGVPPPVSEGEVSRSLRGAGNFFKFELWSAESSGVASEAVNSEAGDKGLPWAPRASAWTDTGCIVRLIATSRRGEGETGKGARVRRMRKMR